MLSWATNRRQGYLAIVIHVDGRDRDCRENNDLNLEFARAKQTFTKIVSNRARRSPRPK